MAVALSTMAADRDWPAYGGDAGGQARGGSGGGIYLSYALPPAARIGRER